MSRKTTAFVVVIIFALIGFVFLVYPSVNPVSKEQFSGSDTLVKVTFSGGLCPYGPCGRSIEIKGDGTLLEKTNQGTNRKKIGREERLTELVAVLKGTGLEDLKIKKFEGTCPTAYDGQKTVYEFISAEGTVVVDSCEYAINIEEPIYRVIWKIIAIDVDDQGE